MTTVVVNEPRSPVVVSEADVKVSVLAGKSTLLDLDDFTFGAPAVGDAVSWDGTGFVLSNIGTQAELNAAVAAAPLLAPATSARNTIQPTADVVPLTLKGKAGQTANLFEIQDSAAAVLAKVDAAGKVGIGMSPTYVLDVLDVRADAQGGGIRLRQANGSRQLLLYDGGVTTNATLSVGNSAWDNISMVGVYNAAASRIGLLVKGFASQTADLQQWRDSAGAIKARTDAAGGQYAAFFQSQTFGSYVLYGGGSPANLLLSPNASYVALLVKGAASQSVDLQQWQDSAGVVLAKITNIGAATFGRKEASQNALEIDTAFGLTHYYNITDSRWGLSSNGSTVYGLPAGHDGGALRLGSNAAYTHISGAGSGSARLRLFTGGDVATYVFEVGVNGEALHRVRLAAAIPLTVRGTTSQSGNLQEWQDSAAAVLAKVTAAGLVNAKGFSAQIDPVAATFGRVSTSRGGLVAFTDQALTPKIRVGLEEIANNFLIDNGTTDLLTMGRTTGDLNLLVGVLRWGAAANEQTTVGAAGAASALPATPTKYLKVKDSAGTTLVVPAYAAA